MNSLLSFGIFFPHPYRLCPSPHLVGPQRWPVCHCVLRTGLFTEKREWRKTKTCLFKCNQRVECLFWCFNYWNKGSCVYSHVGFCRRGFNLFNLGRPGHTYAWDVFHVLSYTLSVCAGKAHLCSNHHPKEGQRADGPGHGHRSSGFWQLWAVHIQAIIFKPQPYVFLTSLKIAPNIERNIQQPPLNPILERSVGGVMWSLEGY